MTLDTISVKVEHAALVAYLHRLDDRGEIYDFLVTSGNQGVVLELQRDGTADTIEVVLKPDGTWFMQAVIVVGEKR